MPERTAESVFRCRWGNDDEGKRVVFIHLLRGGHDEAGEFFAGITVADAGSTLETSDGKMVGMSVRESFFGRYQTADLLDSVSEAFGKSRLSRDDALQGFITDLGNRVEFRLREMAEHGLVEVLEVV